MSAIILVAIVITGSAVGFSLTQTQTYEASIKILVGQTITGSDPGTKVDDLQDLTLTVAEATRTLPVAQGAVERSNVPGLSAGEVLQNTSVEPSPGTNFVNVSYESPDPENAQLIANTIGQVLSQKISEVSVGVNGLTATVWAPATLPEKPVSPDPALNGIIALVLGVLLGIALAFLLEYIDDSWDSPEEVEETFGLPTFGVIPAYEPRRTSGKANK